MSAIVVGPKVQSVSAFKLQVGQHPTPDETADDALVLRGWQARGFSALASATLRILLAPTGSGKSTLIKALAAEELRRDPTLRVIVAVPQRVIAPSFGAAKIRNGESVMTWGIGHPLVGSDVKASAAVCSLMAFLRNEPADTPEGRTLICSHATLVLAHQQLMRDAGKGRSKAKRSPWHKVSLFVDEAHHSRADDGEDGGDGETAEEAKRINNRLGQLVAHWLDKAPGPLLLATATWLRANLASIVPPGCMERFAKYVLTWEEHLARMQHLREVSMRFLIGEVGDALRAIYAEGNAKTIAWLPSVNSPHTKALGGKLAALDAFQGAIGGVVGDDDWTTTLRHKPGKGKSYEIRALDYVTEDGRDGRTRSLNALMAKWMPQIRIAERPYTAATRALQAYRDEVAAGTRRKSASVEARLTAAVEAARGSMLARVREAGDDTPDLLWALGMGKEGFDWPELSRAIVIGERGSIPDVLQMMGRVLRDYPGKERAEFNVLLPATSDPVQVRDNIKLMLASMVVESQFTGRWPWRRERAAMDGAESGTPGNRDGATVGDGHAEPEMVDADVDETQRGMCIIDAIVDGAIRGGEQADPDAVTKAALEAAGDRMALWEKENGRKITDEEYNAVHNEWGSNFPGSSHFQRIYNKTFAEVRDGERRYGNHATEEEVRERCAQWEREHSKKITAREYDAARSKWGIGFVVSEGFQRVYNKTFAQMRDGQRFFNNCATEKEVRERMVQWEREHSKKITSREYNAVRNEWGSNFPGSSQFSRLYNKTFAEVRDGARAYSVALTVDEILNHARAYYDANGRAPRAASGTVDGTGYTWRSVDQALQSGLRGLPGGSSLSKLLREHGLK